MTLNVFDRLFTKPALQCLIRFWMLNRFVVLWRTTWLILRNRCTQEVRPGESRLSSVAITTCLPDPM